MFLYFLFVQSAALRLKNKSSFEQFFFNRGLIAYKKTFYITKTANEWLFSGYQDPFVTIGTYVSKITSAVEVPFDRIGWLYTVIICNYNFKLKVYSN